MISNQRMNSYLKEIAEILGINKRLTTHTARKTFASTILLNNDVPIEIVSKLLGHSSIRVTEAAYAQVMNKNTSRHMNQLKQKLSDYPFMHLLYSQLLVCQRVCLQNTVCLICK